jgi:hypothetical protein
MNEAGQFQVICEQGNINVLAWGFSGVLCMLAVAMLISFVRGFSARTQSNGHIVFSWWLTMLATVSFVTGVIAFAVHMAMAYRPLMFGEHIPSTFHSRLWCAYILLAFASTVSLVGTIFKMILGMPERR